MYLLDTDSLSELIKRKPSEFFLSQLKKHPPDIYATSCICVMELRFGAMKRPDKQNLWQRIASEILSRVHILPFDQEVAYRTGDILAELTRKGTPIGLEDVMIGSTAIHFGCTIITGNTKHFVRMTDLKVENWLRH